MDLLLTITERPKDTRPVSLAISSAPKTSEECVLYDKKSKLETWLTDGEATAGFVSAPCGSGATTMIELLIKERKLTSYEVDHTAKNFQELLTDSNEIACDIVVIDGIDSTSSSRLVKIVTEHKKTSVRKFLVVGHRERKSTSNLFAARWNNFPLEPKSIFETIRRIADGRVDNETVDRIVRCSPTDVRACINALEMHLIKSSTSLMDSKDEFTDVVDAIERIFSETVSFENLYKRFEHESSAIAGGAFDNYLRSADISFADNFSAADVLSDRDYTNLESVCACSVGFLNACSEKKRIKVEKYGTVGSRHAQVSIVKKRIAAFNAKRAASGLSHLDAMDFGFGLDQPRIKKMTKSTK
jgi:hypothetical protein